MSKGVAVEGFTIKPLTPGLQIVSVPGVPSYSLVPPSAPTQNVLVDNKPVYFGNINILIASLSYNGYTAASVSVTLNATGSNMSDTLGSVLLEDDQGSTLGVVFTHGDSSTTVDVTVAVDNPGQNSTFLD